MKIIKHYVNNDMTFFHMIQILNNKQMHNLPAPVLLQHNYTKSTQANIDTVYIDKVEGKVIQNKMAMTSFWVSFVLNSNIENKEFYNKPKFKKHLIYFSGSLLDHKIQKKYVKVV